MLLVLLVGLAIHGAFRLGEHVLGRRKRVLSPWVTVFVCRLALRCLGLRRVVEGKPDPEAQAVVANHSSWLDIFVLNAGQRLAFVSKAEVAGWPGIGLLARVTGTVFIRRDRSEARRQTTQFRDSLVAGDRLLFFPEGTSTDGRRVLPFVPTLFQALFATDLPKGLRVQPISVIYAPARAQDIRFYGWWGDMDFGPHCLQMLAAPRHGSVTVVYHPSVAIAEHKDRKALARALASIVSDGLMQRLEREPGSTGS